MATDQGQATENRKTQLVFPEGVLDAPARAALFSDENPGLLLGPDGLTPLWSSHAMAQALGYRDAASLMKTRLPESAPGSRRLAGLLAAPDFMQARLERLRFFSGLRGIMVTVLVRTIPLLSGGTGLLVSLPLTPPRAAGVLGVGTVEPAPALSPPEASPDAVDWLSLPEDARKPRRFIFALDAQGRIERVSPPLSASVGAEEAAIEGRDLVAVVARFDAEAASTLKEAISSGETWSNIKVLWPVSRAALAIPVELSALPLIHAGHGLAGYAGFGRCRIDAAMPRSVPENVEQEAAPSEVAASPDRMVGEPVPLSEPDGAGVQDAGPPPPETPEYPAAPMLDAPLHQPEAEEPLPEEALSDKPLAEGISAEECPVEEPPAPTQVEEAEAITPPMEPVLTLVPKRAREMPPHNIISLQTGQPTEAPASPQRPGLSLSERSAFRDIARALGARFEDGVDELPLMAEPAAPPEAPPSAAGETTDIPASPIAGAAPALLDHLPMALLILKGEQPLYANRTLLDLVGYPDFKAFIAEGGARAIFRKGAPPREVEAGFDTLVLSTREGETMPVEAHLQLITWEEGRATLIAMRRAVELEQGKALRSVALDLKRTRSETADLRAILDTATDGVITIDEKGQILSLNGAAEALFGMAQNEIVGESFTQLLANDSHADALDYLDGLKANGVRSVLNDGRDVVGREKKGGRIPLFMTLGRINEDEPQRFCAVLRDMTAWKRAEAELLDARRTAELASAKKSDFLAKISHEIRTPMNAILGFAEVMQEERLGALGHAKYKEYLGDIRTSGQHVISLVNDLLDLAKIEAGRMELNFAATDLNAVLASCVAVIQPQANANRVLVRSQLAQTLPPVVADERSIRQIVLNMLSNATRFTESGGQVIVSSALLESGELVIRIRDTGIGMSPTEIEQALEPFRQVGNNRNKGGTGLGLPLTKALVEANRASFAIRSAPGEGTLVEITFPATRVLAE